MGYNIIAELKNIVSAITNKTIPDPNTALGNIESAIQSLGLTIDTSGLFALNGSNTSNFYASDCNSFLSGIFLCDDTTGNMPAGEQLVANPKLLISIANPTTMVCNQIFITYYGAMYFRQYFLNTWGSWTKLSADSIKYTDTNNIGETDVQGAIDYAIANRVPVPNYDYEIPRMITDQSGVDCNTLTNFGFYQVTNALNSPDGTTSWFTIMTIPMGYSNTNYCQQFAIKLSNNTVWRRYCASGTWSAWVTM